MQILLALFVCLSFYGQLLSAAPVNSGESNGRHAISDELISQLHLQLIPLGFQSLGQDEQHSDPLTAIHKVDCEPPQEPDPSAPSVFCLKVSPAIADALQSPSSETDNPAFISQVGDYNVSCAAVESNANTEDTMLRCSSVDIPQRILDHLWVSKFLIFAVIWVTGATIRKIWVDRRSNRKGQYQSTSRSDLGMSEKSPALPVS